VASAGENVRNKLLPTTSKQTKCYCRRLNSNSQQAKAKATTNQQKQKQQATPTKTTASTSFPDGRCLKGRGNLWA